MLMYSWVLNKEVQPLRLPQADGTFVHLAIPSQSVDTVSIKIPHTHMQYQLRNYPICSCQGECTTLTATLYIVEIKKGT